MSTTSPATTPRPSGRYGSKAGSGSIGGKVVAVVSVLLVGALLFFGVRTIMDRFNEPVRAEFISQERLDDTTGRLWIDVTRKHPDTPAYCIVTAVDYSHAEVGRREVILPAGAEEHSRIAVDLPVREPLVSGRIYGCSENLPFYMDPESTFYAAR
ncbi:DUF4307 domain-containing protein [Corynebacterium ureicelerivorans]|uniref:DUF4307 domain-containing protein n=1 Tax=Corynebacterium ureicelerivorans TaxID=401472 RepID=UPI0023536F22|nr:DUF4307 domain-containing protein [Corynebacterium ureicelerivorans]